MWSPFNSPSQQKSTQGQTNYLNIPSISDFDFFIVRIDMIINSKSPPNIIPTNK